VGSYRYRTETAPDLGEAREGLYGRRVLGIGKMLQTSGFASYRYRHGVAMTISISHLQKYNGVLGVPTSKEII
jgi:hypothetical protein